MDFPVDVLGAVRHEELEQEAEDYMTDLRYVSLDKAQSFTLSNHRKIRITLSNVGFVPIYGGDLRHRVLALFAPEDQLTAVALLLAGQWWTVEDILTTSDPSRTGFLQARSVVERIVLYVLNRIIYRVSEMDKPEVPFLCHGQHDFAKILWKDGQAVGFYSVKPKDSLCNHFVTQRYQLPVMDSIFIRKCHRGNGHGLEMLEDFVDSFKEDELGLKYPLSIPMYKLCSQYLRRYPADEALLWVVEGIGGPYQRESVAGKLRSLRFKVTQCQATANGDNGSTLLKDNLEDMEMEGTQDNCLDITEDVVVVNKPLRLIEDTEETPVSTRTRSSERKRGREVTEEVEEVEELSQPLKMSRLEDEDTEAGVVAAEEEKVEEKEEEVEKVEEVEEECSGPVEAESTVAPEVPEEELVPGKEEAPALGVEEVNGELTDDQTEEEEEEEEEEKGVEDGDALENGTAVEDVEMMAVKEEEEEEEDVPQNIHNKDAVPVESEEPTADPETTSPSEEEPATDEAPLTAEPHPETAPPSGEVVEEAAAGPPASLETDRPEEVSALTLGEEEEEEEANPADVCQEEVLLVGVADLSYQPLEDQDIQPPTVDEERGRPEEGEVGEERVAGGEEGKTEVEEEVVTTEEETGETGETGETEETGERSSEGAGETLPLRRKGRGGRRAPKHTSKRRSQVSAEEGEEETPEVTEVIEGEEEEEEEEEKALTIEEEVDAADKTSVQEEEEEEEEEGDEEPPVVDQRALRRKSKPIKSPPKARGKRRSKI